MHPGNDAGVARVGFRLMADFVNGEARRIVLLTNDPLDHGAMSCPTEDDELMTLCSTET